MQIEFVTNPEEAIRVTEAEITQLERKYNIRFPKVLRTYYAEYNDCAIEPASLLIGGLRYEITSIVPVVRGYYPMDEVIENNREEGNIPAAYYPIAFDSAGNKYCWDSLTGNVWFFYDEGDTGPDFMFDSVGQMFDAMNEAVRSGEYVREVRREGLDFLPLGSVVTIKGASADDKLMVIGRGMSVNYNGVNYFSDYAGTEYPEGVVGGDRFFYFNHDNIDKVLFRGYHDDEDEVFVRRLNDFLKRHPDVNRFKPEL